MDADRWEINDDGMAVGQLTCGFHCPAWRDQGSCRSSGIVSWDKERPEPEYQTGLRNETWEIVVTELMFEPDY